MDLKTVLNSFDREQRQEIQIPGFRREVGDHVIRMVPEQAGEGFIIYSKLPVQNTIKIIQDEMDYFSILGIDFEWKAYQHDQPEGLHTLLSGMGFHVEIPDAVMVFDLHDPFEQLHSEKLPDIRKLTRVDEIAQVIAVQEEVWGEDMKDIGNHLRHQLETRPDWISIYAVYDQDQPVANAWITFHPESQFAGLWGGSTLPDFRKRGYYSSLLKIRMQEAVQRGVRYVTVDASPMSQPILENFGFQCITHAWRCVWHVQKAAANL